MLEDDNNLFTIIPNPYLPTTATPRSPKWSAFSKEILKKYNHSCTACDEKKNLDIHHIKPFHLYPELELVEENCIPLCRTHHFVLGHFCDWIMWNVKVVRDIQRYKSSMNRNRKSKRIS